MRVVGETSDFKPNGQSLLATKTKVEMLPRGFLNFPTPFPNSNEEFVSLGLNMRPVFFGRDGAASMSGQFPYVVPSHTNSLQAVYPHCACIEACSSGSRTTA